MKNENCGTFRSTLLIRVYAYARVHHVLRQFCVSVVQSIYLVRKQLYAFLVIQYLFCNIVRGFSYNKQSEFLILSFVRMIIFFTSMFAFLFCPTIYYVNSFINFSSDCIVQRCNFFKKQPPDSHTRHNKRCLVLSPNDIHDVI